MTTDTTPAPLTQEQALDLIKTHQIGKAEVIALRRAICGFVVDANGNEHRLEETCEHLRTADQRPGAGGNLIDQAKHRVGSAMARRKGGHWCGDCGCPLGGKTNIGFDPVTSQPAIYERVRCPLKKW